VCCRRRAAACCIAQAGPWPAAAVALRKCTALPCPQSSRLPQVPARPGIAPIRVCVRAALSVKRYQCAAGSSLAGSTLMGQARPSAGRPKAMLPHYSAFPAAARREIQAHFWSKSMPEQACVLSRCWMRCLGGGAGWRWAQLSGTAPSFGSRPGIGTAAIRRRKVPESAR
jgi:hypothetical protein